MQRYKLLFKQMKEKKKQVNEVGIIHKTHTLKCEKEGAILTKNKNKKKGGKTCEND